MDTDNRGRYRPQRKRRRGTRRRGTFVGLAVVAIAVAAVNVIADGPPERIETAMAELLAGDEMASDRPGAPSRSSDRDEPIGEGDPGGHPRASATISAPLVNEREQPPRVEPPTSGDGQYSVVSGTDRPDGDGGQTVRYIVEVEEGLPFDEDEFAAEVHRILSDERGWGPIDGIEFERVDSGSVSFRVSLSSPDMTDAQCYPLLTRGQVSCWNGARAVINALRWGTGADTFGDDLLGYREYLINHEVGHALGRGHVHCPGPGEPAPVMVQQTKSVEGCEPHSWPER
jgi:hypothetical protein